MKLFLIAGLALFTGVDSFANNAEKRTLSGEYVMTNELYKIAYHALSFVSHAEFIGETTEKDFAKIWPTSKRKDFLDNFLKSVLKDSASKKDRFEVSKRNSCEDLFIDKIKTTTYCTVGFNDSLMKKEIVVDFEFIVSDDSVSRISKTQLRNIIPIY